jgi:diguanylate cyclase (GGDEF)-like protein
MLLIEQDWEQELSESLPAIAQEVFEHIANNSLPVQKVDTQFLAQLRDKYNLSDIHLINDELIVFASTFEQEIGLDMKGYTADYTQMLTNQLNNARFDTHRVSLSTATGDLKKYAYFSLNGSNIIVNGDIDVKRRLELEDNDDIAEYLVGDYLTKLLSKYKSISYIDVFIVTDADQWSLFNSGKRINEKTARALFNGDYERVESDMSVILPVDMESYELVGFKGFLQIDFDNTLLLATKQKLQISALIATLVVMIFLIVTLQFVAKRFVIHRFSSLLMQIKARESSAQTIQLPGDDELSQLGDAINDMMKRIEHEQALNKKLTDISQKDALTGLANRRWFDEKVEIEWNKAILVESHFSLLMIDIDFFKEFNDAYGHIAGDNCLRVVAKTLSSELSRPGDFIARYGGEEFICVLSNTNAQGASQLAGSILRRVESLNIKHDESTISSYVTISIGCLTVHGKSAMSITDLIGMVDVELYKAKQNGRNQISRLVL